MNTINVLRDTRLFADCTEEELIHLASVAQDREYADGEMLFSLGQEATNLMVVAAGRIQLEMPVSILGESKNIAFEAEERGQVVGWSALVPPHRFTLSARVSGGATVVSLPRDDLNVLFESDPHLGFRVTRNLATIVGQRLHHTQEMWAREVQRSLDERYR